MADTAADLVASGARPRLPTHVMRDELLRRITEAEAAGASRSDAIQDLFAETFLDDDVLESVVIALLSGTNLLLIGPPGSGKTSLARAISDIFPKEVVVVADCPVQDDPFSLVDADHARRHPACPTCKTRHGAVAYKELGDFDSSRVDPKQVKVRVTRLREGHGLARLQGSPEVFPDYLTGAINLAKLEEHGDPESPLVLEPGKLMQANRGVLLIDELGKLPRGTQNVLLQALQENVVTPSKSRETFPAAFVGLATSNVDDLESIEAPLLGRFTSVNVPFNKDHVKNRAIVDGALTDDSVHVPAIAREMAVHLMESWRARSDAMGEMSEVASNRSLIDILQRAVAHARLRGADHITRADMRDGARAAMIGRIRGRSAEGYHENREAVLAFLEKHEASAWASAAETVWCRFFRRELDEDKSEGARVAREVLDVAKDAQRLGDAMSGTSGFAKVRRLLDHLAATEPVAASDQARLADVEMTLVAMADGGTFEDLIG